MAADSIRTLPIVYMAAQIGLLNGIMFTEKDGALKVSFQKSFRNSLKEGRYIAIFTIIKFVLATALIQYAIYSFLILAELKEGTMMSESAAYYVTLGWGWINSIMAFLMFFLESHNKIEERMNLASFMCLILGVHVMIFVLFRAIGNYLM